MRFPKPIKPLCSLKKNEVQTKEGNFAIFFQVANPEIEEKMGDIKIMPTVKHRNFAHNDSFLTGLRFICTICLFGMIRALHKKQGKREFVTLENTYSFQKNTHEVY